MFILRMFKIHPPFRDIKPSLFIWLILLNKHLSWIPIRLFEKSKSFFILNGLNKRTSLRPKRIFNNRGWDRFYLVKLQLPHWMYVGDRPMVRLIVRQVDQWLDENIFQNLLNEKYDESSNYSLRNSLQSI